MELVVVMEVARSHWAPGIFGSTANRLGGCGVQGEEKSQGQLCGLWREQLEEWNCHYLKCGKTGRNRVGQHFVHIACKMLVETQVKLLSGIREVWGQAWAGGVHVEAVTMRMQSRVKSLGEVT